MDTESQYFPIQNTSNIDLTLGPSSQLLM